MRYIISVKEYLNKWADTQPVEDCIGTMTAKFLFEYVLKRFGCPKVSMSNRDMHFLNEMFSMLTNELQVYHQKST